MARLDEGDERWIVEDREDGRNVNAWHWEEKNVSRWAEEKYKEMLTGLPLVQTDTLSARVTAVESYSGDVTINHRKGRTMVFFELNITLKWEGEVRAAAGDAAAPMELADGAAAATADAAPPERASGQIKMPYIAEENGEDGDYDIEVTAEKKKAATAGLYEAVRKQARPVLSVVFRDFLAALRAKGGQMAPVKSSASNASSTGASKGGSASAGSGAASGASATGASKAAATGVATASFEQSVEVELPPAEMFVWFTDSGRVSAFTMSPATVSAAAGSEFSLFGGMISGTQEEVVPDARIVQRWRFSSWPAGHYSRVELTFTPAASGGSLISLSHTNIPKADLERTKSGWNENYWTRFKNMLGFSVNFIK